MPSNRYEFKSDNLWQQYQENKINHDKYIALLEELRKEELKHYDSSAWDTIEWGIWNYEEGRKKRIEKAENEKLKEQREADILRIKLLNEQREAERLRNLTPQERYYQIDIPKIIDEYRRESKRYRKIHNRFQWIVMFGSIIVTSTTGATVIAESSQLSYTFKWISVLCSILVSISSAAIGYFKFRERSANLQEAADDIEHEYKAVGLEIGQYTNKAKRENLSLFAYIVENRIKEQRKREQQLEQAPETKPLPSYTQVQN